MPEAVSVKLPAVTLPRLVAVALMLFRLKLPAPTLAATAPLMSLLVPVARFASASPLVVTLNALTVMLLPAACVIAPLEVSERLPAVISPSAVARLLTSVKLPAPVEAVTLPLMTLVAALMLANWSVSVVTLRAVTVRLLPAACVMLPLELSVKLPELMLPRLVSRLLSSVKSPVPVDALILPVMRLLAPDSVALPLLFDARLSAAIAKLPAAEMVPLLATTVRFLPPLKLKSLPIDTLPPFRVTLELAVVAALTARLPV